MELRIARHTERFDELVAFYCDGLGLQKLGRFEEHDGFSGAYIGITGTRAHIEFTAGGRHPPRAAHPEPLIVLYLGAQEEVDVALQRLGASPVTSANPYWDRSHAVTVLDPAGHRVVLAPHTWD